MSLSSGTLISALVVFTLFSSLDFAAESGDRLYTVQFSSFTNKDKAEKLMNKLKDRGLSIFLSKMTFKRRTFFRICSGTYATPQEAAVNMKKMSRSAGYQYVLIQGIKSSSIVDDSNPFAVQAEFLPSAPNAIPQAQRLK